MNPNLLIIGAGIFGLTAALELHNRGYSVTLVDPGTIPHPLAASTDISKIIRMEYGPDETYMALAEEAIQGWRTWNEDWKTPLFHESGVLMITREPMQPGGFEYESYQLLLKRGHAPERMNADEISRRFPTWKPGAYVDGFYHAVGGNAESGRVVEALVEKAKAVGITVRPGFEVKSLVWEGNRIVGVVSSNGERLVADHVVVAAGAWTPTLVPEAAPLMHATGHPVFHLKINDPKLFTPPHFVTFTADIARSGWYGFPVHPREGILKIGNHGAGKRLHPTSGERTVDKEIESQLRTFLRETFPSIEHAPVPYTRLCLYSDTLDEHFLIGSPPETQGLTIASGGSGHGFKFAPVLGRLIADAVEGKANAWTKKFGWRELSPEATGEEAARFHG